MMQRHGWMYRLKNSFKDTTIRGVATHSIWDSLDKRLAISYHTTTLSFNTFSQSQQGEQSICTRKTIDPDTRWVNSHHRQAFRYNTQFHTSYQNKEYISIRKEDNRKIKKEFKTEIIFNNSINRNQGQISTIKIQENNNKNNTTMKAKIVDAEGIHQTKNKRVKKEGKRKRDQRRTETDQYLNLIHQAAHAKILMNLSPFKKPTRIRARSYQKKQSRSVQLLTNTEDAGSKQQRWRSEDWKTKKQTFLSPYTLTSYSTITLTLERSLQKYTCRHCLIEKINKCSTSSQNKHKNSSNQDIIKISQEVPRKLRQMEKSNQRFTEGHVFGISFRKRFL